MTDTIRCPACRGCKKVPKLGGMIGECNTCSGKGTILAVDKPVKVEAVTIEAVKEKEFINAVADCVPVTTLELKQHAVIKPDVKIDGKKALYKRKKA